MVGGEENPVGTDVQQQVQECGGPVEGRVVGRYRTVSVPLYPLDHRPLQPHRKPVQLAIHLHRPKRVSYVDSFL
jgi:hypothetical protein